MDEATWYLYRWFDETDRLLYVGISRNLKARFAEHRGYSWWMRWAVRVEVAPQAYSSAAEAHAAEVAAIHSEEPVFNLADNPPSYRLRREYFDSRGFTDPDPYRCLAVNDPNRRDNYLATGRSLAILVKEMITSGEYPDDQELVVNRIRREHKVSWRQAQDALELLVTEAVLTRVRDTYRIKGGIASLEDLRPVPATPDEMTEAQRAEVEKMMTFPRMPSTPLRQLAKAILTAARMRLDMSFEEWGEVIQDFCEFRVLSHAPERWETTVDPPGEVVLLALSVLALDPEDIDVEDVLTGEVNVDLRPAS